MCHEYRVFTGFETSSHAKAQSRKDLTAAFFASLCLCVKSMLEVADACEDHGQAVFVGGADYLIVAN